MRQPTFSSKEIEVIYRALSNSIAWENSLADAHKLRYEPGYMLEFDVADWKSHVKTCKAIQKKLCRADAQRKG